VKKGAGVLLWVVVLGVGALSLINFFSSEPEQQKIGYVDIDRLFEGFDMKNELQGKLELELKTKEIILDSIVYKLSLAKTKAEAPDATDELKWNFQQQQNYFFQEKRGFEEFSMNRTQEYDQQILKQMTQYVADYGLENNFKVILGKNSGGNVLYGDVGNDVTDDALEAINAKYQGI